MIFRRKNKGQIIFVCLIFLIFVFVIPQTPFRSLTLFKFKYHFALNPKLKSNLDNNELKVSEIPKSMGFHGEKIVHLDLKGAPPTMGYLREFIPFIKYLGATGLMIEYEDMFPYSGKIKDIKAGNAYSLSDIEIILKTAENNNLQVIPFINLFDHFEFVLKLRAYKRLREKKNNPKSICTFHEKTFPLVFEMIDQVLKAHPRSIYLHIGGDYFLGECSRCNKNMKELMWDSNDLYLNYVTNITFYIKEKFPKVVPILSGENVVNIPGQKLLHYDIPDSVELMVKTADFIRPLSKYFEKIWIASNFKGGTLVDEIIPNEFHYLKEYTIWMTEVKSWNDKIGFKGYILIGQQRFDHFAELCELLPVSIPSLALGLRYLNGITEEQSFASVEKYLHCNPKHKLYEANIKQLGAANCEFPGFAAFKVVNLYNYFAIKIKEAYWNTYNGWVSVYNLVYKFSNPYSVNRTLYKWPLHEYRQNLREFTQQLQTALSEVYDQYTVSEWMLNHVVPIRIWLDALENVRESLMSVDEWPQRPFINGTVSFQEAFQEICRNDRDIGCGVFLFP